MSRRPVGSAVLRADANARLGFGHLRRGLILLKRLREDGFRVRVVTESPLDPALLPLLGDIPLSSFPAPPQDETEDARQTLSIIGRRPTEPSWAIVDHYWLGERWERRVREAGRRVLVIDDFRDRRHHADVLVSDSALPFDPALNHAPVSALALAGSAYALIGPEFAFGGTEAAPAGPKRLLVSYGGSDPTGESRKALEAVRRLKSRGAPLRRVDLVVGSANARRDELSRFASGVAGVVVHCAPPSLAPLLRETDLVLTSGGNSMVEALCLRKPCLVTRTSANQALMVSQLARQKAIVLVGGHESVAAEHVADALSACLAGFAKIWTQARQRPLFDHLGVGRVSEAMRSFPRGSRR